MNELGFMVKTFQAMSNAKRDGTWGMVHQLVIVGLVVFVGGFIGFLSSMILRAHGAVFVFFASFILGLLTFVISAITVQVRAKSGSFQVGSAEEAGVQGERHVAHQLSFLPDGYNVFNNLVLRHQDKRQQIDHLVIGPNGVFHIETKTVAGELSFTERGFMRNGQPYEDPTGQVYRHQFILEGILREAGIACEVVGVICFAHPNSVLTGTSPQFITCRLDRLLHNIVNYSTQHKLEAADVDEVRDTIKRYMGPIG